MRINKFESFVLKILVLFMFVGLVWAVEQTHFGSDVCPVTDGTYDLGTSSLEWQDGYIDGTLYVDDINIGTGEIGENFTILEDTEPVTLTRSQYGIIFISTASYSAEKYITLSTPVYADLGKHYRFINYGETTSSTTINSSDGSAYTINGSTYSDVLNSQYDVVELTVCSTSTATGSQPVWIYTEYRVQ